MDRKSGKRSDIRILVGALLTILLVIFLAAGYYVYLIAKDEVHEEEDQDGKGCMIYTTNETASSLNSTNYLTIKRKNISLEEPLDRVRADQAASNIFDDPLFDQDRSFDDMFAFTENGSDDILYLSIPFGTSIVFMESYDNSMTRIPTMPTS